MINSRDNTHQNQVAEYAVIGGGPAAIIAVIKALSELRKIYGSDVPKGKLIWIDPEFKVGEFGTTLSAGSSVPGNTAVESYQKVNEAIYAMIPSCSPSPEEKAQFEITSLAPHITCSLKTATQPMQHITNHLRKLVTSIEGSVPNIQETKNGIQLDIKSADGTTRHLLAQRVILAVGAKPKTWALPNTTMINPNIAFIESELKQYLQAHPGITHVTVIGSSHSAALATMYLLKAGITVKQFMNKEYKFATPVTTADGMRFTQFDNTGLKGEVATFTRQLLNETKAKTGSYAGKWQCYIGENVTELVKTHLTKEDTHAVVSIGYVPSPSIKINGAPLSQFSHDKQTTQLLNAHGQAIRGVFGVGIAFPLEVKAISGEVEFSVGVGKFWNSISAKILSIWKNYPATTSTYSISDQSNNFFKDTKNPMQNTVTNHFSKSKL